jgi:hypothetical protein
METSYFGLLGVAFAGVSRFHAQVLAIRGSTM